MARQKGMLNLSGNLEPLAGAPLDSRSITPTVADLYIASNWPYKYIGMKTTVTATGDTYRLVNLDVTQESSWVKEGGESGQTIQYDELPAASSSLAGEIYQYTGTTNLQYTNGYFYECVNDGGTYKWVQTNTQPGSSYNDFTGATAQAEGSHGLVPAPTTGDISKFLKGDGTWATVPMPSFDYSNTSPEAMNFSTDEKVIGTWIDGKPLYQRTVSGVIVNEVGNTVIPLNVSCGYMKLVSAEIDRNNCYMPLTQISLEESVAKYTRIILCDNRADDGVKNSVLINNTLPGNYGYNAKVTVQYTKTTDSAVASGEKIVGQWIDGKPVYEKCFTGTFAEVTEQGTESIIEVKLNTPIKMYIDPFISIFSNYQGSNGDSQYIAYHQDYTNNVEGVVRASYHTHLATYGTKQDTITIRSSILKSSEGIYYVKVRYTKTTD